MGCTLHEHGHAHGHSHAPESISSSKNKTSSQQNLNVRAAFIHVVGDFVQSCGVFIAALIIYFEPQWKFIDPICTFLFSILVLITTLNIMKVSFYFGFPFCFILVIKNFLSFAGCSFGEFYVLLMQL